MFNTQILAGSSGQGGITQQSLKFNDDESQYLSWTPAAAQTNTDKITISVWVKRANISNNRSTIIFAKSGGAGRIAFESDNTILANAFETGYNGFRSSAVFRDPSAWYHIVYQGDSTLATAADRNRLWVNGVEQVNSLSSSFTPLNQNSMLLRNGVVNYIGRDTDSTSYNFDGYMSDMNVIDGAIVDPTSFGQFTNGYWEAKDYAGTYGTNGFHLTFQDDVVSEGFNAVTYRGNGGTQSISGLGFSPDFVWIKRRDASSSDHYLADIVRGATKQLISNSTAAEGTNNGLTSFDSDGFSVGAIGDTNANAGTFVAWAWDAGSGSAASNTDGSITSTVKANPSYGFSIVSYTGTGANATVGHGLSAAPDIVILKNRSIVSSWLVRTQVLAANQTLLLENTTTPIGTDYWQNTQPDSSVFSVSSNSEANGSGNNLIAYCFAEVAGYSSIGTYSGNGSTSGPTVTTGFPVAFVMVKRTDSTGSWFIVDNTRDPRSSPTKDLQPNSSGAETDNPAFYTFTSTGFQLKTTGTAVNASGGTYIYMAFADTREAAFWKDVSGQGNHWTPNNLDYRDSLIDSPANNFAVGNNLILQGGGSFSEGNLKANIANGSNYARLFGTIGASSGKWYWEFLETTSAATMVGIASQFANATNAGTLGYFSYEYSYYATGQKYNNASLSSYGASYTSGDVIGVALDLDAGTLTFYKNGSSQGVAFSSLSGTFFPALGNASGTSVGLWNFGQDSTFAGATTAGGNTDANGIGDFKHPVPSGFLALATANLLTPTIIDGSEHFNTMLYTGNGSSRSITGVGFSPDWIWFKARNVANGHVVYDTVRGATKYLQTASTSAEGTGADSQTSFDSDGFSLGADTSTTGVNQNSTTYVAWNWKAGGTAVSNTDGSITSQVSANTDAGFSIVSYTGTGTNATVGHGLSVAPNMVIVKNRGGSYSWLVYHKNMSTSNPATFYMSLNQTSAASNGANVWINNPTSTVFTVSGSYPEANSSSNNYIAYCFANTEGYSKAGSYTGNGSTDGPFVYTGFRPAWIMIKKSSAAGTSWYLLDNKRDIDNVVENRLIAESANAEGVGLDKVDFLSNGFKLRENASTTNHNATYIYLAFAETPFKYANAR